MIPVTPQEVAPRLESQGFLAGHGPGEALFTAADGRKVWGEAEQYLEKHTHDYRECHQVSRRRHT